MSGLGNFEFSVTDQSAGITYTPWTDGHAVGFMITYPDGQYRYIYLNPTGDSDGGEPDVFLYMDREPGRFNAVHYYDTRLEAFDE